MSRHIIYIQNQFFTNIQISIFPPLDITQHKKYTHFAIFVYKFCKMVVITLFFIKWLTLPKTTKKPKLYTMYIKWVISTHQKIKNKKKIKKNKNFLKNV